MEKQKKPILLRFLICQIGLLVSWYLGQKNIVSPIISGSMMLVFIAGIFYTIYQRNPAAKNTFLIAYLFIVLILVWLYILPAFS